MPSGVAIAEAPSGRLLFHNDEAVRLLRHPMRAAETYEGYVQYGGLHADGQPCEAEEYPIARSVLSGEVVKAEELRYRRGDGSETVLSINAAPIFDRNGQQIAAVSTFEDIGSRKRAEQDRLLLSRIVESSNDAIIGFTPDRRIISWNRGAERIFGYKTAEILGQDIAILAPVDRRIEPDRVCEQLQRGEAVDSYETQRQRKDGTLVDVAVTISPIAAASGEMIGVSATMRDITLQKRLEQERERLLAQAQAARAEAEAANRSKDEFVSLVAHELRSPLNAILGWAKLLQTRSFDPPTTHRALETIVRNTQAQAQLIEDLLDVSRMVRGTLPLDFALVNLVEVVEAAIETARLTAEAKGIQLEAQLSPTAFIQGDFNRLQQVVLNLLTNAIKFTPDRGQVRVLLNQSDRQIRLQISDTGKGISPDFLPYIFDRFRQDPQSATARQGLGLGLAIVKYIVEHHHGTITVQSEGEGQGATFIVLLPLRLDGERGSGGAGEMEAGEPGSDGFPQPLSPSTSYPLSGLKILVVDDDPDMLTLTTLILEQAGAIVQTANRAAAALGHLQEFRPDLLLSDIAMPGQDGYDLLQQVRLIYTERIPAIALTAYASQARREDSLRAGFDQHLTKPVEPEALMSVILSVMQRREV